MYTKCTQLDVKEGIIKAFCIENGQLRIVIATIAFAMGLDCPNIRQVIHWGPSSDIETFVQGIGRGGRDGYLSCSLLFFTEADHQWCSESMIEYCHNSTHCRRKLLFKDFDHSESVILPCTSCRCCDICMKKCACTFCNVGVNVVKSAFHVNL